MNAPNFHRRRPRAADYRRADPADHPVPRRDRRARGQGRQVRRPARRGRPGRTGRRLRPRRGRRTGLPRHHRVERRPPHDAATWSAHRRRRCSSRSPSAAVSARWPTCARLLAAGADKVSINTRCGRRPELIAGGAPRLWPPVHRRRHRCPARPGPPASGWEVFTHGGRTPTGLDARGLGRATAAERGAGEILLTSMDRDGTHGATTSHSPPRSATPSPCR